MDQSANLEKNSLEAVKYLWRSDTNPFSSTTQASWEPYEKEDIYIMEKAYQKFVCKKGPPEILLKKVKNHKVDFSCWNQISLKNSFLQRPFKRIVIQIKGSNNLKSDLKEFWFVEDFEHKIEEIKNLEANRSPFFSESIQNKKILEDLNCNLQFFFWRSDADPFSSLKNAIWTQYNERDSLYLEDSYQKYLIGGPDEVLLENSKYKINFKVWLQISISTPFKRRPICRGNFKMETNNTKNIFNSCNGIRGKECNQIKEQTINNPAPPNLKRNLILEKKYFLFCWQVGNDRIEFFLPKEMNYFKGDTKLNLTVDGYLNELNNEIKNLNIESEYQNKKKKYDFSEILSKLKKNPSKLFETLTRLYISENFFNYELNKLLKNYQNGFNQGFKIKYLFVGLMAAIVQLSEKTKYLLKYEYFAGNQNLIKVFRGSAISEEEVDIYKKNPNVVRQINSFLSTSIDRAVAIEFLNKKENKKILPKALFEYELRISQNPFFTFLNTNDIDKHDEKEILIHNEVILQTTKIVENPKNQFQIYGKIISSGWKGFFQYVLMNPDLKELNLSSNDFGNGNSENMRFFKEALACNKTIVTLDLNNNNFGSGSIENLMLLKEALLENKSIIELNLNKNGLGKGSNDNLRLLKEAIIGNENIAQLNLADNQFCFGDKENMRLLKEILKENKYVKYINLGYNGFGQGNQENMKLLKEALFENKSIISIDLCGNNFGKGDKQNLKLLKEAIVGNKLLKCLHICDNDFGLGEIKNMNILMETLIENKNIKELYLGNNGFGIGNNEILCIFKETLSKNTSIKRLYLNNNNFTSKNKEKDKILIDILIENSTIEYLDLSGNYRDEKTIPEIKRIFGERIML